tara:strand:+ start:178 stop:381 length:204 start_codon:yes stop_codon:yes gene_type:complete
MPSFVVRMFGFKVPMTENAAELVDKFGSEVDDWDWTCPLGMVNEMPTCRQSFFRRSAHVFAFCVLHA